MLKNRLIFRNTLYDFSYMINHVVYFLTFKKLCRKSIHAFLIPSSLFFAQNMTQQVSRGEGEFVKVINCFNCQNFFQIFLKSSKMTSGVSQTLIYSQKHKKQKKAFSILEREACFFFFRKFLCNLIYFVFSASKYFSKFLNSYSYSKWRCLTL